MRWVSLVRVIRAHIKSLLAPTKETAKGLLRFPDPHLGLDLLESAEDQHACRGADAGLHSGLCVVEPVAVALDAFHGSGHLALPAGPGTRTPRY